MYPQAPIIYTSKNYDEFKMIEWNRPVDKGNFQKLLKENREQFQLHNFPILVNEKMEIIDGQHRYMVAQEMGSPVYYVVSGLEGTFKNVHSVNKAGKKHSIKDKLEMLKRSGNEDVENIYKVFNLYEGVFGLTLVARVLTYKGTGEGGRHVADKIDLYGTLKLSNYKEGLEVLDALYYGTIPEKGLRRTVLALMALSEINGVHPKAIVKRVADNASKWIPPNSKEEAEKSIATCYNYGLAMGNRIKTSKAL